MSLTIRKFSKSSKISKALSRSRKSDKKPTKPIITDTSKKPLTYSTVVFHLRSRRKAKIINFSLLQKLLIKKSDDKYQIKKLQDILDDSQSDFIKLDLEVLKKSLVDDGQNDIFNFKKFEGIDW